MTKTKPRNVAASVRERLLQLARERGEAFQLVLTRYANERLLYRLAVSQHASSFVLKGAALFTVWTGKPHRATRDVDLLGFGDPSEARMRSVFEDVLTLAVEDDGMAFDIGSMEIGPIRDGQEYGGLRMLVSAGLTEARVKLQVDVGFGDAITPEATVVEFPPLLAFVVPWLRVYSREMVVVEKLEAMVKLSLANTRMKDFYDVVILSCIFDFDGVLLVRAIRATFERRKTALPEGLPPALTSLFSEEASKISQWRAFLRKSSARDVGDLDATIAEIVAFAEIPLSHALTDSTLGARWPRGGPWS